MRRGEGNGRSGTQPRKTPRRCTDTRGHDALKARLVAELKMGSIQHCCGLTRNPRPLFWIPRHKILLCETHWGMAHLCGCFEECDFCGFSISEGTLVMVLFDTISSRP